jgi:hypothetical protein
MRGPTVLLNICAKIRYKEFLEAMLSGKPPSRFSLPTERIKREEYLIECDFRLTDVKHEIREMQKDQP